MSATSSVSHAELAGQILKFARKQISHRNPILLRPVYALEDRVRLSPGPLSTDGTYLYYHPDWVLNCFQHDRNSIARQLLHLTLHCLMGHLGEPRSRHPEIFDNAADLKVTMAACALCGRSFILNQQARDAVKQYNLFRTPPLTLLCSQAAGDSRLRDLLARFRRYVRLDDHELWHPKPPKAIPEAAVLSGSAPKEAGGGEEAAVPDWNAMQTVFLSQLRKSAEENSDCGFLQKELSPADESGISYYSLLKKLMLSREHLQQDPDTFDPRWYHLGLSLYGNIPLLEPSECSERPAPDDLVIAIDTSGSCNGEICRRFLRETLQLLDELSRGQPRFHTLVLQCDTHIREQVSLTCRAELEDFPSHFVPKGFGGTDFRPVFREIEQQQQTGALPRVRALIYFSDGMGAFPEHAPPYPVIYILPDIPDSFRRNCGSLFPDWVTAMQLDLTAHSLKEVCNPL